MIDSIIIESAYRANAQAEGFAGKVKVLGDMTGVKINIPIRSLAVFPPSAGNKP